METANAAVVAEGLTEVHGELSRLQDHLQEIKNLPLYTKILTPGEQGSIQAILSRCNVRMEVIAEIQQAFK